MKDGALRLQDMDSITLLESRSTIELGTTGLRTWRAAFRLADWLLGNPEIVRGSRVLELGSGTGFLGVLIGQLQLKAGSVGTVLMTDCNTAVLDRCMSNVRLESNQLQSHGNIEVKPLDWFDCLDGSPQRDHARAFFYAAKSDVIVGTDLVYDPEIIPALSATLDLALNASIAGGVAPVAYMALNARRDTTFNDFVTSC
ncbi:hypothetical protein FRB99_008423, partial [Tulasnella sp. 403]